ncbi:hypothetical protein F5Y05DRAFT_411363 [Hypoxylon sp. FL0543]|nr:hypothetical protein F5Y05DRAFT_411363 [Hypoxylon sp. FL0543]
MKTSQNLLLALFGASVSTVSAATTTCPNSEGTLQQDGVSVCCPYATRWDASNNLYCCAGVSAADADDACGLLDPCGHDLAACDPPVAVTDPDYSSKVFGRAAEATPTPSSSSTTFTDGAVPTVGLGSTVMASSGGVSVSAGASTPAVSTGASQSTGAASSAGASGSGSGSGDAPGTGDAGASSSAGSTSTSTGGAAVPTQAPLLGLAVGAGVAAAGWYGF